MTLALGSTLATMLLTEDVALIRGLLAFALLIALRLIVAWFSVRSRSIRQLVTNEPRLLAWRGEMLDDAPGTECYTPDEVSAAVRCAGIGSLEEVEVVVLETERVKNGMAYH